MILGDRNQSDDKIIDSDGCIIRHFVHHTRAPLNKFIGWKCWKHSQRGKDYIEHVVAVEFATVYALAVGISGDAYIDQLEVKNREEQLFYI